MKSMRISAMHWAMVVAMLLVSPMSGMVGAAELLVDRCDSPEGWGLNLGSEYPGTQGSFAMEEMDGRPVLRADLSFDTKDHYGGLSRGVRISEGEALLFEARVSARIFLRVRVIDGRGRWHQTGMWAEPGKWQRERVELKAERFWDKTPIIFPLQSVLIGCHNLQGGRREVTLWLREVAVEVASPRQTWEIGLSTNQSGNINFLQEPTIRLIVPLTNRVREQRQARVRLAVRDLSRRMVAVHRREADFSAWGSENIEWEIPNPGSGFYRVDLTVQSDGRREQFHGAFGVVPRPRRFLQRDPESFFGMHSLASGEAAARIGVHWVRSWVMWRFYEYEPGVYPSFDFSSYLQSGIDVLLSLDTMGFHTIKTPAWFTDFLDEEGLPNDQGLETYARFVRHVVRESADTVEAYEIENEPDCGCYMNRELSLDKGAEFYARIVEKLAPIIREEASGAPIVGLDVCPTDYGGFPFSRAVMAKVGHHFDIFGGHPYASSWDFGPGKQPQMPEANREAEKHAAAAAMLDEFGGDQQLWVTEKGWVITDDSSMLSDPALAFADCLARSLIIARSNPRVKKYFWFMMTDESAADGPGERFTLWRFGFPLPGAIAYANVAHRLEHAKPVESFALGPSVQVHLFSRPETGHAVAAVWAVSNEFGLEADLPACEVFDLYGRQISADQITITSTPVFIESAHGNLDKLRAALHDAHLSTDQSAALRHAYLTNISTVRLAMENYTTKPLPVEVSIGTTHQALTLPATAELIEADIDLANPANQSEGDTLAVAVTPEGGAAQSAQIRTELRAISRAEGLQIDGQSEDWQGIPRIVLNERQDLLPAAARAQWEGAGDLSVKAALAWDSQYLYLLVMVDDSDHHTPGTDAGGFWNSDSIQVAIDVMNDAAPGDGFSKGDFEYGMVVADQALGFETMPTMGEGSFKYAGQRQANQTIYEMAFPWKQLGRHPVAGDVFSLNLVVYDNDEADGGHMQLSRGIREGKDPSAYPDFYLGE